MYWHPKADPLYPVLNSPFRGVVIDIALLTTTLALGGYKKQLIVLSDPHLSLLSTTS